MCTPLLPLLWPPVFFARSTAGVFSANAGFSSLRVLRIGGVFRLFKRAKQLEFFCRTLVNSLPSVCNITGVQAQSVLLMACLRVCTRVGVVLCPHARGGLCARAILFNPVEMGRWRRDVRCAMVGTVCVLQDAY